MQIGPNMVSCVTRNKLCLIVRCVACVLLVACSSKPTPGQGDSPIQGAAGTLAPPAAGTLANQAGTLSVLPSAGQTGSVGSAGINSAAGTGTAGRTGAAAAGSGGARALDDADAGPMDRDKAGADGTGGTPAVPSELADYTKAGPYKTKRLLNQGMGTISGGSSALLPLGNSNDPSAFTLYFPDGAPEGERFPLLTFGNGTFCSPTFYDVLIGHVVSFGFIVVATNTSNTGSAAEMLKGVEWALAQDKQSGSPIFGHVDGEHIGAFGHSQGGAGTCRAGADMRIDAIAPLSGTSDAANIKCPAFFVTTGGEAESSTSVEQAFMAATPASVYGVTMSGNHDEYTDVADDPGVSGLTSDDAKQSRAGVAAWFDWQLKGKSEVRALFVGTNCTFCAGSTWKTIKSKGF
jgi:hypothetical protein